MTDDVPIRNAATVIAIREGSEGPTVLMGQRGKNAVFMPERFVFPGGAVDEADFDANLADLPDTKTINSLEIDASDITAHALVAAACREFSEETGLKLGKNAGALIGGGSKLEFIFRAITPKGRPRRFDARFFLIDANEISGDLDDFSCASDELSHLHWVPLAEARGLKLAFITEVVLGEVEQLLRTKTQENGIPFFKNDTAIGAFVRIKPAPS